VAININGRINVCIISNVVNNDNINESNNMCVLIILLMCINDILLLFNIINIV